MDKCTIWITDEMDMTPLQVSCWRGKCLRGTQEWYSFNYYLYTIEQWALRSYGCEHVSLSNSKGVNWMGKVQPSYYVHLFLALYAETVWGPRLDHTECHGISWKGTLDYLIHIHIWQVSSAKLQRHWSNMNPVSDTTGKQCFDNTEKLGK